MTYKRVSLSGDKYKVVEDATGNVLSGAISESAADELIESLFKAEQVSEPRTTKAVMGSKPAAEGDKS